MSKLESKLMGLTKTFVPGIVGLVQLYYGEPNPGWASVKQHMDNKATEPAFYSAVAGLTGLRMRHHGQQKTEIDFMGVLNPFDLRNAPVPKVVILTRLAIEGVNAVGQFISSLFKDILK